jgi:S-formylglutathione hydrolase
MEVISESKAFDGIVKKFKHSSNSLSCEMKISVFVPLHIRKAIVFLSGLTCNEDNFITKSGALEKANELGLLLCSPDTSPRGHNIPGDCDSYDFGIGAGFYLDATESKWAPYQMFSYITKEVVPFLKREYNIDRIGIMGHSMVHEYF